MISLSTESLWEERFDKYWVMSALREYRETIRYPSKKEVSQEREWMNESALPELWSSFARGQKCLNFVICKEMPTNFSIPSSADKTLGTGDMAPGDQSIDQNDRNHSLK